ncbi:MAG: hypothetical protein MJZ81_08650, partial [Bacteroidales bacterium]|nr:hypothetical protein [Bacteroidales bacterium]
KTARNRDGNGMFFGPTFNGKEKDYESGFHYYGARYYWSETLTGWLSVDPMVDKYPSLSPYNYCAWNPIKRVDPDGRDDYETDRMGHISRCKNQTNAIEGKDRLFAGGHRGKFDKEGKPLAKFIEANEGTFEKMRNYNKTYKDTENKDVPYKASVINFDEGSVDANFEKATEVFEFLARNTDVEWTFTGHKDDNSESYPVKIRISTSHMRDYDPYSYSFDKRIGQLCIFSFHNHFNALGPSDSDREYMRLIPNAVFGIYQPFSNSYRGIDGKNIVGPKSIKL